MRQTIYYLFFSLVLLLASCMDDVKYPPKKEYVETTFQLRGEIPEMLLASSENDVEKKDLYGIEVLHVDETPYAYGLFDDLGLAKASLVKGEEYTFRIMVVPNGKKLCFDYLYGDYVDIFCRIVENLGVNAGGSCPLTNEFYFHKEVHFWEFNNPGESFYYENYAGYYPNYIAESDNVIHFDMKRMFGIIRLEAKNLVNGKLEFQFLSDVKLPIIDDPTVFYYTPIYTLSPDEAEVSFIYSLRRWGDKNIWLPDDYSFVSDYTVRWIDENGKSTELGIYPIKVQRGQETIVTLDLSELL